MIEARNLKKSFIRNINTTNEKKSFLSSKKTKEEFFAVNDISLAAKGGEILGILGPNGAGKTTLLRMLGNLMTPTSGKVIITDEEGNLLCEVSEEILHFTKHYSVEIYDEENEELLILLVLAINQFDKDQDSANSSAAAASSNNGR